MLGQQQAQSSGALCKMGYPSETHLTLKSREISFVHNIRFSCPIVLKFCTEYGSITDVFRAKFQNDWIRNQYTPFRTSFERGYNNESRRDFTRVGFKMGFRRTSYITQSNPIAELDRFSSCIRWSQDGRRTDGRTHETTTIPIGAEGSWAW